MTDSSKLAELYFELRLASAEFDAAARQSEELLDNVGEAGKRTADDLERTEKGLSAVGQASNRANANIKTLALGFGAVAGAATLAATAATAMAGEVDAGIRRAISAMPELAGSSDELRDEIERLSTTTGMSQKAIAAAFAEVAESGVASFGELTSVMRAAVLSSEATGRSLSDSIQSLDLALDVFGASATEAEAVVARLFAATQGRVAFEDLTRAIQLSTPTIKEFQLNLDDTVTALANLIDGGHSPAQAAKELKGLVGATEDAAGAVRELAGAVTPSSEAMDRLRESAQHNREDARQLAAIIREQLNAEMIRLGNDILPSVVKGLSAVADGIRTVRQAIGHESLYAGLRIDIPDGGPQIRKFISDNDRLIEAARNHVNELQSLAQRAERIHLADLIRAPFGPGSRNERISNASRDLQEAVDYLNALERASTQARAKLESLKGAGGFLPDLIVTAASGTGRIGTASDAVSEALEEMRSLLAQLSGQLFPQTVEALHPLVAKMDELAETLERGTEAQRAEAQQIRATAEQFAAALDVLGDMKPELAFTTYTTADIQQIDRAAQAEQRRAEAIKQEARDKAAIAEQDARDVAAQQERLRDLIEQGRQIDAAVQGALDLARAFGLADDEILNILGDLSQVATGIGPLVAAIEKGGAGGIIGAALPVVGGLASLVGGLFGGGTSPETQAAIDALKHNAGVLERIAARLDQISLTGSQLSGVERAVERFLSEGLPRGDRSRFRVSDVEAELKRFGLTMDDLRTLAREMGLEFVELNSRNLPAFLAFLDQIGERLTKATLYGNDGMGRVDLARDNIRFSAADETAGQQLRAFVEAAVGGGKGGGLLATLFKDFDFDALDSDDPAVRNAARAAARSIIETAFGMISSENLDAAELGGLIGDFTLGGFRSFLGEILGFIPDALDESGDDIATAAELWAEGLRKIGQNADVFDFTAVETAQAVVEHFKSLSPVFAEWLAGFDLTTIEGIGAAIEFLQGQFAILGKTSIHGATNALDEMGLSLDDLAAVISYLKGGLGELTDEAERLAEAESRAAEQARREAERAAEEQRRRWDVEQRERERAHQEEMRRLEEQKRLRLQVGAETLQALQDTFRLFDITDEAEQLGQVFELLKAQAPVFRSLFGGLSADSAGDRAEALQRLRDFQLANPFGRESGNLSADVVRRQVLEVADLLKNLARVETTVQGELGSFAIDRSITELRGERLEGLLSTGNIWLEDIAGTNAQILAALTVPSGFSGITPPALSAAGTGGSPLVGTLVVNITVDNRTTTLSDTPNSAQSIGDIVNGLVDYQRLAELGAPRRS